MGEARGSTPINIFLSSLLGFLAGVWSYKPGLPRSKWPPWPSLTELTVNMGLGPLLTGMYPHLSSVSVGATQALLRFSVLSEAPPLVPP